MKPKHCVVLLFPVFVACTQSPLGPSMTFRRVVAGFGPFADRNVQVLRDALTMERATTKDAVRGVTELRRLLFRDGDRGLAW
jgi:hypothetical protein